MVVHVPWRTSSLSNMAIMRTPDSLAKASVVLLVCSRIKHPVFLDIYIILNICIYIYIYMYVCIYILGIYYICA